MAPTALRATSPELSASVLASLTTVLARWAPSAILRTVAVISSRAAAVSSRLAACCSVRRDRFSDALEISSAPLRIPTVALLIDTMASASWPTAALKSMRSLS